MSAICLKHLFSFFLIAKKYGKRNLLYMAKPRQLHNVLTKALIFKYNTTQNKTNCAALIIDLNLMPVNLQRYLYLFIVLLILAT